MKKIALSLFALALTIASIAQKPAKETAKERGAATEHRQHHRDHKKGHDFQDKLNLTDAQKQQAKQIREDFKKQMKDLKDQGLTEEQLKEKRRELAKQEHDKMQSILTAEQREKAKDLRKEEKKERKDDWKDRKEDGAKRAEKMKEELDLTDAQSTQLKSINENFRKEMKAIHENSSLTGEQKKQQMKQLQQKHKEQIQSLLTAEQKEKVKDRVKNHSNRKAVK